MRWTHGAGLSLVVATWCLGVAVASSLAAEEPEAEAARVTSEQSTRSPRERGGIRASVIFLVALGSIAAALMGLGLLMLVARWAGRLKRRRQDPVRTEMEDLWAAAGKRDLPPPVEDDEP